MLCENCKKNKANYFSKTVINGKVEEHNLCSECAGKMGLLQRAFDDDFNMFDAFIDFKRNLKLMENNFRNMESFLFNNSPFMIEDEKEDELIGNTFEEKLKNIEDGVKKKERKTSELDNLKIALKKAVDEERYEDAAVINKKIKEIEKKSK